MNKTDIQDKIKNKKVIFTVGGCVGLLFLCGACSAMSNQGNKWAQEEKARKATISTTITPTLTETTATPTPTLSPSPTAQITASPSPTASPTPSNTPTPTPEQSKTLVKIQDLLNVNMDELAKRYNVARNAVGSVIVKNDKYELVIESKNGSTPTYIELSVKELGTCKADKSILDKVNAIFPYAGLDGSKKGNPTNSQAGINIGSVAYENYQGGLKVGASCLYNDGYYMATIRP